MAVVNGSHHPMNILPMETFAAATVKHSGNSCSAQLVINSSTLVDNCYEDLHVALLQDSHYQVKAIRVNYYILVCCEKLEALPYLQYNDTHVYCTEHN